MAEISKPDNLSLIWASGGDVLDPGNTKYSQGWEIEIPPRQWFNFYQNRVDTAIAHVNQHGIPQWDSATEYRANKSYAKGSDGIIYKAVTTNTNIDPTTDLGTNWTALFLAKLASTAEAQGWTSNNTVLSPLRLADSYKGSNQSLNPIGFQKYPGGKIEQWGEVTIALTSGNGSITTALPTTFPTQVLQAIACFSTNLGGLGGRVGVSCPTTSTIQIDVSGVGTANTNETIRFLAWGK